MRGQSSRFQPVSGINVTPFVDVMLVLLVIFMLTAPLMTVGVPVDLPKTDAKAINDSAEPLVVSIDQHQNIFIQEREVELENLTSRLKAITNANPDARIFVRGDKRLPYGEIMSVMGEINASGFKKVALITDLRKKNAHRG